MKANIIFVLVFFMFFTAVKAQDTTEISKIDSVEFKILTAGSLNFYGTPQFSRYAGQLDIRLPSLIRISKLKTVMGINVGVFTKNYYSDSLFRGTRYLNIKKMIH